MHYAGINQHSFAARKFLAELRSLTRPPALRNGEPRETRMPTALISHDACIAHDMGDMHPESPQRLLAIRQRLADTGLADDLLMVRAKPAKRRHLLGAHPEGYIGQIETLAPKHGLLMVDPDTAMCPASLRAAKLAAGAVVQGTDLVYTGRADSAFCAVRPPGHHAEFRTSMGFCLFNNVAVGVHHAMQAHGAERVAVLDFDVHHCNGTIDIFKDEPGVLVCSSFQHPYYPFRYADIRRANIVNTPLAAGTRGAEFRKAVERDWLPAVERHRPQIIFVSAGFDAHRADPLADLLLDESDFRWVTALIVDLAERYAGGRIVATLEGGYDLEALASSVQSHLEVLSGQPE